MAAEAPTVVVLRISGTAVVVLADKDDIDEEDDIRTVGEDDISGLASGAMTPTGLLGAAAGLKRIVLALTVWPNLFIC